MVATMGVFRPAISSRSKASAQVRAGTRLSTASSGRSILSLLASRSVTTTANLGRAMIQAAAGGYSKQILLNEEINRLSA